MKGNRENEVFLAEWMSGSLSDSDLKVLVTSEEYESFLMLRERLDTMTSPSPDYELRYQQLKKKIATRDYSVEKKPIKLSRIYSIAASLSFLILVGSYHDGFFGQNVYSTASKVKTVSFGKNVVVTMHHHAVMRHNAPLYNTKRVILNRGEAYFEVVTGTKFLIATSHGIVEVVGTKFTVNVANDLLEVTCFEGKVKVNFDDSIYNVAKGNHFNSKLKEVVPFESTNENKPGWLVQYKKFDKIDLSQVIYFIEKNYAVSIVCPISLLHYKFTGTIPLDNLEDALKLVCYSFNLKYELHDKTVIFKE